MFSSFWLLEVELRDFSHAEKERTACKAEQINLKRQPRAILSENSCHFVNLLSPKPAQISDIFDRNLPRRDFSIFYCHVRKDKYGQTKLAFSIC